MKLLEERHIPGKGPGGAPITRTVRLYRDDNGKLVCQCPYACLATYERCEFADRMGEREPVMDRIKRVVGR